MQRTLKAHHLDELFSYCIQKGAFLAFLQSRMKHVRMALCQES